MSTITALRRICTTRCPWIRDTEFRCCVEEAGFEVCYAGKNVEGRHPCPSVPPLAGVLGTIADLHLPPLLEPSFLHEADQLLRIVRHPDESDSSSITLCLLRITPLAFFPERLDCLPSSRLQSYSDFDRLTFGYAMPALLWKHGILPPGPKYHILGCRSTC